MCYLALSLKTRFGFDDSLDVIAVHLVGGLLGSMLLGLFADTAVNSLGFDGLFFGGGAELLVDQIVAVGGDVRLLLRRLVRSSRKAIDTTIGLRVSAEDEMIGLDQSQHAETAYQS